MGNTNGKSKRGKGQRWSILAPACALALALAAFDRSIPSGAPGHAGEAAAPPHASGPQLRVHGPVAVGSAHALAAEPIFLPYTSISDRISKRGLIHVAQLGAKLNGIGASSDALAVAEGRQVVTYDADGAGAPVEVWRSGLLPSPVLDIDWSAVRVCVALGQSGLQVYRAEGDASLSLERIVETPGPVIAVECDDDLAFLGMRMDGLRILDLSDADTPTWRGHAALGSDVKTVHLWDDLAHVAIRASDGSHRELIFNVGDPDRPEEIASLEGRHTVSSGDTLYVEGVSPESFISRLQIYAIDRADRSVSWLKEAEDVHSSANGHGRRGRLLFRASWGALHVFDIDDPREPRFVAAGDAGGIPTAEDADIVAPDGSTLVHVRNVEKDGTSRIDRFDVTDSGSARALAPMFRRSPQTLRAIGTRLLLLPKLELRKNLSYDLYELGTPALPQLVARYEAAGLVNLRAIDGHIAAASANNEIIIYDLSDPFRPEARASIPIPPSITDDLVVLLGDDGRWLHLEGHESLIGLSYRRLAYDLSDPGSPRLFGEITGSRGSFGGGVVLGGRAYVPVDDFDIGVADFSDPAKVDIQRVPGVLSRAGEHHLAVVGSSLVIATDTVLDVLAVADPGYLRRIASLDLRAPIVHISGRNDIAIVTTGELDSAIVAIELSRPHAPSVIGRAAWPDRTPFELGGTHPAQSVMGDGFVATVAVDAEGNAIGVEVFTQPWMIGAAD